MTKKVKIDLSLLAKKLINPIKDILSKSYILEIFEYFLNFNFNKSHHNLENHFDWFVEKIRINHRKSISRNFKKYSIYYVNYGINVGNEINGIRPSIIFKNYRFSKGEDIIVIPITSFHKKHKGEHIGSKQLDKFDIVIDNNVINGLKEKLIIKTRHLKSISNKRISGYIGKLENTKVDKDKYIYDIIDYNIKQMLGIE